MVYTLRFFSSKCSLFHNSNVFGSCIIHILYTVCAKIKKKKFRRQKVNVVLHVSMFTHHPQGVLIMCYKINEMETFIHVVITKN